MPLISKSPFIQMLLRTLMSKLLDFSELPKLRHERRLMFADLELLMFERELMQKKFSFSNQDLTTVAEINKILKAQGRTPLLVRMGSKHDGGYVIPKESSTGHNWISFGIGNNCDFENQLALNSSVYCFDHTIDSLPFNAEDSLVFFKLGLSNLKSPQFCSLDHALEVSGCSVLPWSLKLDIEGNEWDILPQISALTNPPQVLVIEFHHILLSLINGSTTNLLDKLEGLSDSYISIFSNVNNYGAVLRTQFGLFADTVEVTFVHKDYSLEHFDQSPNVIQSLRFANNPNRHSLQLE